jgi:hypothetical protein
MKVADEAFRVNFDPDVPFRLPVYGYDENEGARRAGGDGIDPQVAQAREAGVQRRRRRCRDQGEEGAVEVDGYLGRQDGKVRKRPDELARLLAGGCARQAHRRRSQRRPHQSRRGGAGRSRAGADADGANADGAGTDQRKTL